MKSICTYLGDIALFPHFTFTFDDHEKELIKGLFDLQIKRLIARRRVLLNKLKKDFPNEDIIINGRITSTEEIKDHLNLCDCVMIGRSIYQNPNS